MPRLFADECVAALVVEGLAAHGFDILDAKTVCQGDSDDHALALAEAEGRVVITEDRGFGELAVRHAQPAVGVIVLALHDLQAGRREAHAVEQIIKIADQAEGNLVVIEPGRIRIRPLPGAMPASEA